jgi:two-component system sensor histidine kinase BaeS
MLEAIQDGVVTEAETIARYHAAINDEVSHLARLIDDLFELSRLDAGQLHLDRASVDLSELLCETVGSLTPRAEQQHIRLELAPPGQTGRILADPFQIQRVLVNLLENAMRHSREGGIVCVSAHPDENGVAVEVSDTGEGINADDMPYVFDRFYRGEKSRARQTGGAGLGLAISKAIVEAHEGQIWAESLPQEGARFVFTLPFAPGGE